MTTIRSPRVSRSGPGWPAFAVPGVAVSLILTALGTFTSLVGPEEPAHEFSEWLVVAAITLVAAAIAFGIVARLVTPENAGTAAAVFGVVGLASVLVFWTGLPAVLASAALACAMAGRGDGPPSKAALAGAGLAVATLVIAVAFAIYG